jgi:hypothetical protein
MDVIRGSNTSQERLEKHSHRIKRASANKYETQMKTFDIYSNDNCYLCAGRRENLHAEEFCVVTSSLRQN